MKKIIIVLVALFSLSIYSQTEKEKALPIDPSVKIGKLENGLTYYIKNNKKPENKVELRLVVNAGSILETEDQLGLAHFMEHMCFNGTKNFKKNDLVDYLQSIGVKFGAHLNAYTSFDETVYMLPIPSDNDEKLEKGFQIIEDWAHNALLTGKDIDEERGVVLEEYRLGQGADERMLQNYLPKIMHGSMYAKRLPIGTKENIENFEHQSVINYYKDWYRPNLMAVIAVGDVSVEKLEEKIKEHFSHIKNPENIKERKDFEVPNHKETLIAIESDKEAPFSRVQVLFKDKDVASVDNTINGYRKMMLESLFSQMINNRLDELRNSPTPPFVYGYSFYGGTWARTKNAYQSFAMCSEDGQLNALKTLLEENERVKKYGFNPGEFERAKKSVLARLEKMYKDKDKTESRNIVREYINNFLEQEPIPGIEWEFNFYKNVLPTVQLSEINALINDFIHKDNRVIVITGPEKEGLEKVTEQQVLDLLKEVETKEITPYEDEEIATSLISKLPKTGSIVSTSKNEKLGTTTLNLSNGAKVTYKKTDFKNDEILFSAYSYGGTSLYTDEELKLASFANSGLAEAGINNFSKTDLSKMLSGKIVRVRPTIGSYSEGFSGTASPKDFEELFQLVHLYFTSLNKDEKAFKSFISKQKAFLGNLMNSPQFFFQREITDFLNEGNPRYSGFPSAEKYDKADYNIAYTKYKERFADAGDFNFYFVGNIDENKLAEFSKIYLASLPGLNSNETYNIPDFRPKSGSHKKVVEKGKDPKSSVQIRFQGETKYNKKEAHYLKSLGEILTIKLIEKLRESESGVYGVGARGSISKLPYGKYNFTISFPCGPENVDKLKDAALAELKTIVDNGPTDKDLIKVKEAQILDYKESIKKNNFWLNLLKNSDYEDVDASEVFSSEEKINAITNDDIQKVAEKYLTKGYILAIHNPEK